MKLALVGVGNAGCRVVNRIHGVEQATGRNLCNGNTLLVNTNEPVFDTTAHIDEERRLLIGDVHPDVGEDGIDGDPELGAEVARDDRHEVIRAFDHINLPGVDGVLVVAGLGRGTGGGAGAVVIDELQSICDEPVYALAVLPSSEADHEEAMNAARALQSFVEKADNVIGFDNDEWGGIDRGRPKKDYREPNAALATRVVTLFAAGERNAHEGAEHRIDPSDMIRTLETSGVSSIGYASTAVGTGGRLRRWLRSLSWPWTDGTDENEVRTDAKKINRLVRRAARSQLTLPCDISSTERALIMLSGPSRELSRKGFEGGRYWLEQEADTVEVMAGDEPHESASELTAVVLLSNVTEVPRIEELKEQAVRA